MVSPLFYFLFDMSKPVKKEVVCSAMADDQEEEAVGVPVKFVLGQLPLDRVHPLAGQVPVDLHLKSWGTELLLDN